MQRLFGYFYIMRTVRCFCLLVLCYCTGSLRVFAQQAANPGAAAWVKDISLRATTISSSTGAYPHVTPGFALYYSSIGGIKQPYLVYVPESYDPAKKMPLLVFLHGAILALDSFQYRSPDVASEPVFKAAADLQCIVIFPFARRDFKWTTDERVFDNILQMIADTRQKYNIDPQRIYAGGQSMGGNATFWFVKNKPGLFAGFYTFSAALASECNSVVGKISARKPLVSVNASDDGVFSYAEAKKAHDNAAVEPGSWVFETAPSGGHRFIYAKGGEKYVKDALGKLLTATGK